MKKCISILLLAVLCLSCSACSAEQQPEMVPEISQMKTICELATMKCYYHNVAKYFEEEAEGALWWGKDRKFWIEYAGEVTVGIDVSLVNIEIDGDIVTITIPPAKVMDCVVDPETLTEDSFIIAAHSAKVEAEHQTKAFSEAQANMYETANNDTVLLASAQQRAQKLLENYVNNIGESVGKTYQIKWVYLNGAEALSNVDTESIPQAEE